MAGKPNKTQPTAASVEDFLTGLGDRRRDAASLCGMMARLSGEPARMWGPSIVGFGVRRYRYESGREGEICKVGFSPRKAAMALYIVDRAGGNPQVAALGNVTTGKSCIYVKSLADIDLARLETLIAEALAKP